MAYQALYRKYRPQTFSQVVGQEHITETLQHELASGKISHAYLFTGTRGTGKTSCAKILSRAVNCMNPVAGEPCGECELCRSALAGELTDIVEIDAASNNGVDSIRELREQVSFTPAAAKYRVYIIDEVHMLSIGAFNALLKTLEEPPAHVVFILATTEVHKLPATILSRCQRFDFRRIDPEKICERLQTVARQEGLTLTDGAAMLIASAADGGMRDALSVLDLCAATTQQITEDTVASCCGMAGNEYLLQMAEHLRNCDTEKALLLLDELHRSSVDTVRLVAELTEHFRNLMIAKTVRDGKKPIVCSSAQLKQLEQQANGYELSRIIAVLSVLQETAGRLSSGNRRCEMEMAVIRLCNPAVANDLSALEQRISILESRPFTSAPAAPVQAQEVPQKQAEEIPAPVLEEAEEPYYDDSFAPLPEEDEEPAPAPEIAPQIEESVQVQEPPKTAEPSGEQPLEQWDVILKILRTKCPLIAGVLNDSKAYIRGAYLLIDTQNSQFRTMVNGDNSQYRDQIRSAAQEVLGQSYKLGPYRPLQTQSEDPLAAFAQRLEDLNLKN